MRQNFQALIKQWWNELGVKVELRNIAGSVFFGGDAGSPDTFQKFFADVEMYANNFEGADAEKYLGDWVCSEFPSPEDAWQGGNTSRFCSEEYEATLAKLSQRVRDAFRLRGLLWIARLLRGVRQSKLCTLLRHWINGTPAL